MSAKAGARAGIDRPFLPGDMGTMGANAGNRRYDRISMGANRRGWMQIIEVVIAAMLLFYYIGYAASAFRYTQSPVDDHVRFRKLAEDTLITLDNTQLGSTTILRDDLNKRNHTDLLRTTDYFIRYPYTYSYEITYHNETYLSKSMPKKPSASANYFVIDMSEGKPVKYAVKLTVWAAG